MRVARYDYAAQFEPGIDDIGRALRHALLEGRYGVDCDVAAFEREFAGYVGVAHGRGVNSGTDALRLALTAIGVGSGDEVVTQANTFHATVAAIVLSGATPILVDADPQSFLIDVAQVAERIGPRTTVLLPVHLYGKMTPLAGLVALAQEHGLAIVEDAAQAHGARDVHGHRAGSLGLAGCFSFHPSKNLAGAGDGGMVVTEDDGVAEQLLCLRALGQRRQNDHVVVGLNSKLHALQAIVLRAKLPRLDDWNARRRQLARAYRAALDECPVGFQAVEEGEEHVYHLFQIRTPRRDALLAHLRAAGIDAVVRFPVAVHRQPAFADRGWRQGEFPIAEALAQELLCLPLHPAMPQAELDYVVTHVREFFRV